MLKRKMISVLLAASVATANLGYVNAADSTSTSQQAKMPAKQDGQTPPEMFDGQTPPEMPNGEMPDGQTPPEKPDGEMSDGQTPPEKPDGEATDNQTPPEMPNNQQSNTASKLPFKDVAEDAWYYTHISNAYNAGLVSGFSDTEFSPQSQITGAQLITILYRGNGNTVTQQNGEAWYTQAVNWAYSGNILSKDMGWSFEPNANLNREQMMVIIYRYLVYKGEVSDKEYDLSSYSDYAQVSEFAQKAVKYLVSEGIISGDGKALTPKASLTRAQTAVIANTLFKDKSKTTVQQGTQNNAQPSGQPGGFGSTATADGTASNTIDEDGSYSSESYTSTADNDNALLVDGAKVELTSIKVNKSAGSSSNTESGDFYGVNAALLIKNGATATIKNSEVTSAVKNGNGIFSYGEGTTVNIYDTTITTTGDNSGGIQTTGGGMTNAYDLTVNTSGNSAAAIRSDRGGGTVKVNGGTYTSNGYNSPAVYSTADITVKNAKLTANNSEALVIEGKNSINLENCTVSGNMSDTKGSSSDENVHNIMIYQSMSGDAAVGTSEFDATGGTITSNNGDMFYITNTNCVINLNDVKFVNNDDDNIFMTVVGNSATHGWGKAGSNGANADVNASAQKIKGDIVVDNISTLDLSLKNGSDFTGTINITENSAASTAVDNNAVVTIDKDSTWTLTGNCTISKLNNSGTINYNSYTITLADGTVLSD